jgi:hypothetical protein
MVKSIRKSAEYNPAALSAPVCILWPDREKRWLKDISAFRKELPELLTLGDYVPDSLSGPGIWIRCAVAGRLDEYRSEGKVPIVYVPGFGIQNFLEIKECPDSLRPLAELQYRGVFWSQSATRDWTPHSFFTSDNGGLGLDIPESEFGRESLASLLSLEVESLSDKRPGRDFFNLRDVPDPDSYVLKWLNDPKVFDEQTAPDARKSFLDICRDSLGFDPEAGDTAAAAGLLAGREGRWSTIWNRFKEAPNNYPKIPERLGKLALPKPGASGHPDPADLFEPYPKWNSARETELRSALRSLNQANVRERIPKLEKEHSARRGLVWAKVGQAPLARSLEHLAAAVAACAEYPLNGGNAGDLEKGYVQGGWRADDGIVRALSEVKRSADVKAVSDVIRCFYERWLYDSATRLQEAVVESGYPGKPGSGDGGPDYRPGDCVLFVDGLRFDVAKRLSADLSRSGFPVSEKPVWATLPSVTATGKPAVSPVKGLVSGKEDSEKFMPCVRDTGTQLETDKLEDLLERNGWSVLNEPEEYSGQRMAWCECRNGNIDHFGHDQGANLAGSLESLVAQIYQCVSDFLDMGWKRVFVVTDHGWLLMPAGLPKSDLPGVVTKEKWGRCASVKPGAKLPHETYPWHWNPDRQVACAPGSSCYVANRAYAHGGLSLQECLNLRLEVSGRAGTELGISEIRWKGCNCIVTVTGDAKGMKFVLRKKSDEPSKLGSILAEANVDSLKVGGEELLGAKLVLDDFTLEGELAVLTFFDRDGYQVDFRNIVLCEKNVP